MLARRVVFIGSKQLGVDALRAAWLLRQDAFVAVVTFDDTQDSRSVLGDFRRFCDHAGLPLEVARDRQHAEQLVERYAPDLCLVVCWYWLFSDRLLASLPRGAVGVHNSLLPKYRGGSPLVWALINGEREAGFSVFSIASGMDQGDIWWQERVPIRFEDPIGVVLRNVNAAVLESFHGRWIAFLDGELQPSRQDHAEATYCAQRTPDDGGIDWKAPAERVYNFIRAQSDPYPGAFAVHRDQRVYALRAELFGSRYFGAPGQVSQVLAQGEVIVVCGDNRAVVLKDVSVKGEIRAAAEVFSSIRIRL